MPQFQIGDIVTFSYQAELRKKPGQMEMHDKFPQVLVLHDNWAGNCHGINLNQMSQQEINYLTAIVDPFFAQDIVKKDMRIRQELQRLSTQKLQVTSPQDFYQRFIKNFTRNYDGYRLYKPEKMINVRIVKSYKDIQQKLTAKAPEQKPGEKKKSSVVDTSTQSGGDFFQRYVNSISRLRGPRFK